MHQLVFEHSRPWSRTTLARIAPGSVLVGDQVRVRVVSGRFVGMHAERDAVDANEV